MQFSSFRIKNFKGIEDVEVKLQQSPKGHIFTLVGLNESGKTTVLEAINYFDTGDNNLELLYNPLHRKRDIQDLVPKSKKANFTGKIEIEARILVTDDDRKDISRFCLKQHNAVIDIDRLGDSFTVTRNYVFEDSEHKKTENLWSIDLWGYKKPARTFKELKSKDELWQAVVLHIRTLIPSICYFPTFLFDFPTKIYLEETENETKTNAYYRTVVQDILDSLNENLEIQKHIVDRVKKAQPALQNIFNTWLTGDTRQQIDHVLLRLGDQVTRVVFKSWNEVFKREPKNKSIKVNFGVEGTKDNGGAKVYLQFYIEDGTSLFSIAERSLGFRWFFCFLLFTQFRGASKRNSNTLFLFDEPASNLHSRAQMQLLSSFAKITEKNCRVIYSTHSHYMINPKWLENTFIVINEGIHYEEDDDWNYSASRNTNIKVVPYRTFVGQNPDKHTYFQPILDNLDYRPSPLENIPDVIMLEGKYDFYILKYFSEKLLSKKLRLNFLPGSGANDLGSLLSLYLGWSRNFVVLLDSDSAGLSARKKYLEEWLLPENKIFTFTDVDAQWKNFKTETLINDSDKEQIKQLLVISRQPRKKELARFFQERLVLDQEFQFSKETGNSFLKLLNFLNSKLNESSSITSII